jgi:glucose-6-phosphate-specific signal transduction histidine kinase
LNVCVTDEGQRHATSDGRAGSHVLAKQRGGNGASSPAAPGQGIRGMRERCQLLGGDLTARSLPSGGFEVNARLPLAPTQATQ